MKNVIITLLLTASCFAQTPQPATCATIAKCKANAKAETEAKYNALAELSIAKNQNEDLQKQLADKTKQYDDAVAILDTLASQIKGQPMNAMQQKALADVKPGKAFDLGIDIEKATGMVYNYANTLQKQLKAKSDDYASLVDRYNATLDKANAIINGQNERLARQQRVNNALAIYSMMPKSQPYVLPPPPVFNNTSINCASNSLGSTTYTNCH